MSEKKEKPLTGGKKEEKPNRNSDGTFAEGREKTGGVKKGGKFSLVSILKDLLKEIPKGKKVSVAEKLMREAIQKALKGDTFMLRDIINRVDGMPKQTMGFDIEDVITELNITIKTKPNENSKPGINNSISKKSGAVSEEGEEDNNQ